MKSSINNEKIYNDYFSKFSKIFSRQLWDSKLTQSNVSFWLANTAEVLQPVNFGLGLFLAQEEKPCRQRIPSGVSGTGRNGRAFD